MVFTHGFHTNDNDDATTAAPAPFDADHTIVVATGNPHKIEEIRSILADVMPEFSFVGVHDVCAYADPVEDGATFFDNAVIKARAAMQACHCVYALADDSGLCVDALDGAPGIYSARFAGEHGNDKANTAKLLSLLTATPMPQRRAHFHCSVVLIKQESDATIEQVFRGEGNCFGYIAKTPTGTCGFGYDPVFLPDEHPACSMAELSANEKNAISHRKRALVDLMHKLCS